MTVIVSIISAYIAINKFKQGLKMMRHYLGLIVISVSTYYWLLRPLALRSSSKSQMQTKASALKASIKYLNSKSSNHKTVLWTNGAHWKQRQNDRAQGSSSKKMDRFLFCRDNSFWQMMISENSHCNLKIYGQFAILHAKAKLQTVVYAVGQSLKPERRPDYSYDWSPTTYWIEANWLGPRLQRRHRRSHGGREEERARTPIRIGIGSWDSSKTGG